MATTKITTTGITDSSVSNAKLGTDISAAKLTAGTIDGDRLPSPNLTIKGDTTAGKLILNCETNAHGIGIQSPLHASAASYTLTLPTTDGNASEYLQTDGNGVLTWAEAGGGITAASQWRLTADLTGDSTEQVFTANLEVVDTDGYGSLGSDMTESSGVFTFPSTGYWLISFHGYADLQGDSQAEFRILTTVNNADYGTASEAGLGDDGSDNSNGGPCTVIFDVTSTTN